MQYKITIPEPCRQSWDKMTPDDTGRYCHSCKKSVIDFTSKTDEEITQYILDHANGTLCGRFKYTQVQRIVIDLPENIFHIQMPLWMRFLVACLLIFGISLFPFETTIAGKTPAHTVYYQGEPYAYKSAKKPRILKKKTRIRYQKSRILLPKLTEGIVYGNIWGPSGGPVTTDLFDTSYKVKYPLNLHPGTADTKPGEKEKTPEPPYTPTEFILPKILSARKENINDSMD